GFASTCPRSSQMACLGRGAGNFACSAWENLIGLPGLKRKDHETRQNTLWRNVMGRAGSQPHAEIGRASAGGTVTRRATSASSGGRADAGAGSTNTTQNVDLWRVETEPR